MDTIQRTCERANCNSEYRAKGLCAKHYNQLNRKPNPVSEYKCPTCGEVFVKESARANRYANVFCSTVCAGEHKGVTATERRINVTAPILYRPRAMHAFIYVLANPSKPSTRVFASGPCRVCGKAFTDLYGAATCGDECQAVHRNAIKREGGHKRRALLVMAYVSKVDRLQVYRKDEWVCQLCGVPTVHDAKVPNYFAPTLDHIVPLARGGKHEPSNVQTAHYICNSYKRDSIDIWNKATRAV